MRKTRRISTRERMEETLAARLSKMLDEPITSADIELFPATGYWRQSRADVMQFTGYVQIGRLKLNIGCWESMSDCLAYGFDLEDCRGQWRAEAEFMCTALDRRVNRSENWYSGPQLEEIEFQKRQADSTR